MKHPIKLKPKTSSSTVEPTENISAHGAGPKRTTGGEFSQKHKEESIPHQQ
jgi:hypothetical protein